MIIITILTLIVAILKGWLHSVNKRNRIKWISPILLARVFGLSLLLSAGLIINPLLTCSLDEVTIFQANEVTSASLIIEVFIYTLGGLICLNYKTTIPVRLAKNLLAMCLIILLINNFGESTISMLLFLIKHEITPYYLGFITFYSLFLKYKDELQFFIRSARSSITAMVPFTFITSNGREHTLMVKTSDEVKESSNAILDRFREGPGFGPIRLELDDDPAFNDFPPISDSALDIFFNNLSYTLDTLIHKFPGNSSLVWQQGICEQVSAALASHPDFSQIASTGLFSGNSFLMSLAHDQFIGTLSWQEVHSLLSKLTPPIPYRGWYHGDIVSIMDYYSLKINIWGCLTGSPDLGQLSPIVWDNLLNSSVRDGLAIALVSI